MSEDSDDLHKNPIKTESEHSAFWADVYQTVFGTWLVILPVSYALVVRPFKFGRQIKNNATERRRAILYAFEALVLIGIVPGESGIPGAIINNLVFPLLVFLIASVSYWFLRPSLVPK